MPAATSIERPRTGTAPTMPPMPPVVADRACSNRPWAARKWSSAVEMSPSARARRPFDISTLPASASRCTPMPISTVAAAISTVATSAAPTNQRRARRRGPRGRSGRPRSAGESAGVWVEVVMPDPGPRNGERVHAGPADRATTERIIGRCAGRLLGFSAMHVAYQGEPGAYSERAVRALFPGAEPMPCETVRLVFSRVTSGEADHGVVPLENSQAGSVNETYDLLQHTSMLHIVGEAHGPRRSRAARRARGAVGTGAQGAFALAGARPVRGVPVLVADRARARARHGGRRPPGRRGRRPRGRRDRERGGGRGARALGARGAHPDREGEPHEVRGDLDPSRPSWGPPTRPRS